MDGDCFDHLVHAAASRRRLLGGGLALAAAWLGLPTGGANAKRKPKSKPKPRPNAFGCRDVGVPCQQAGQCCSGICQGKKGRRRCRAHDTGGCEAGAQPTGCGGASVACTTSLGQAGICATTTGNAGYCLAAAYSISCRSDVDCQVAVGGILGPRAACIRCGAEGTTCVTPDDPQTMELAAGETARPTSLGAGSAVGIARRSQRNT